MNDKLKIKVGADNVEVEAEGQSVTRITDSLLDALSPFTQGLALAGDHLKVFRQRAVLKALKEAQQFRLDYNLPNTPVSPKILIPWIEGASMEGDGDDNITDLWAKLLATAQEEFSAEDAYLMDMFRRIGSNEANVMKLHLDRPLLPMGEHFSHRDDIFVKVFQARLNKHILDDELTHDDIDILTHALDHYNGHIRVSSSLACSLQVPSLGGMEIIFSEFSTTHERTVRLLSTLGLVKLEEVEIEIPLPRRKNLHVEVRYSRLSDIPHRFLEKVLPTTNEVVPDVRDGTEK